MKRKFKNEKGITLVALVVTIIILIILAGVSINSVIGENGIITISKRAKENIELAQIEEQTKLNELYMQIEREEGEIGRLPYDAIGKLSEFKKKIADYIDEAANGQIDTTNEYTKLNSEIASVETFGQAIKQIVAKVTALDEAKAATTTDIAQGKEAWVNGKKIVGTNVNIGELTLVDHGSVNITGTYATKTITLQNPAKMIIVNRAFWYNGVLDGFDTVIISEVTQTSFTIKNWWPSSVDFAYYVFE